MKFRGILNDSTCINHFTKVVATIAKLGKVCVLRFTSDKLYFIQFQTTGSDRCYMWCELEQAHFFHDYFLKGVSDEQNEIYLEVVTSNMIQALKSSQSAKTVTIKLTKRNGPCLTHEIELPSLTSGSRIVTHDVPIILIQRTFWDDYEEPTLPAYDVSLVLPSLATLKNVVDRMKHLSNHVTITGTKSGNLVLKIETASVIVTSTFTKIINVDLVKSQQNDSHETRIDIRKLAQLLASQQLNPNKIVCNIQSDRMAHFLLAQQGLSLQYFLPAVSE